MMYLTDGPRFRVQVALTRLRIGKRRARVPPEQKTVENGLEFYPCDGNIVLICSPLRRITF
jgi:hypothetical protein